MFYDVLYGFRLFSGLRHLPIPPALHAGHVLKAAEHRNEVVLVSATMPHEVLEMTHKPGAKVCCLLILFRSSFNKKRPFFHLSRFMNNPFRARGPRLCVSSVS